MTRLQNYKDAGEIQSECSALAPSQIHRLTRSVLIWPWDTTPNTLERKSAETCCPTHMTIMKPFSVGDYKRDNKLHVLNCYIIFSPPPLSLSHALTNNIDGIVQQFLPCTSHHRGEFLAVNISIMLCVCACVRVCECVCVCARMCVCMCMSKSMQR